MKSVLISIQPKWVEKISSGEKTIEVRKTRPKIETPFKCYIYCTKAKEVVDVGKTFSWGKEIIGEFVCKEIDEWKYLPDGYVEDENEKIYYISSADGHATCLTYDEIENYGKGKTLYGWHISDLKTYDKPRELFDFVNHDKYQVCKERNCFSDNCWICPNNALVVRPPQSWCYVESLGE